MKAVLLSVRPKWCEKIASGEKTIEVRKTRPKLETPFKVYIYETLGGFYGRTTQHEGVGKVIAEFVCDHIDHFDSAFDEWANCVGKPAGSIVDSMGWDKFLSIIEKQACLSNDELSDYFPEDVDAYLWHISDLKIYDKPMGLGKLTKHNRTCYHDHSRLKKAECADCMLCNLVCPPQSWCYVDEMEDAQHAKTD